MEEIKCCDIQTAALEGAQDDETLHIGAINDKCTNNGEQAVYLVDVSKSNSKKLTNWPSDTNDPQHSLLRSESGSSEIVRKSADDKYDGQLLMSGVDMQTDEDRSENIMSSNFFEAVNFMNRDDMRNNVRTEEMSHCAEENELASRSERCTMHEMSAIGIRDEVQVVDRMLANKEDCMKDEVDTDESASDLLMNLNQVLSNSDNPSEYIDSYRPRGRPRGPKHPIWNFFKFCKAGGVTMGYMCKLCGNDFTGPPNTTNASKHLRCRHKTEYMTYYDLVESAKHGTFFGDVNESIQELILKSKVSSTSPKPDSISTNDPSQIFFGSNQHPTWLEGINNHPRSYLPLSTLSSPRKFPSEADGAETNLVGTSRAAYSDLLVGGSSSNACDGEKGNATYMGSTNEELVGQMESFVRDYRRLEKECRLLRMEMHGKDEQIKALRIRLLEEQNRRKNALILVQKALLDDVNNI